MKTLITLSLLCVSVSAFAQEKKTKPQAADVSAIKDRYWAQGDENELSVVQNRLYSKAGKFELGAFGAIVAPDPFVNVFGVGGSIGYHFNELWSLHAFGWKSDTSPSAALNTLRSKGTQDANVNDYRAFYGGEIAASVLYGKLSLLGKKIIYYDFHLLGGAGVMDTANGSFVAPSFGVGQQMYLTEWMALRIDYRLMPYKEDIIERVDTVTPGKLGTVVDTRTNWTNTLTLGVSFLIGG